METKQHIHHYIMVALANNPYLVIEYRNGHSDWMISEFPSFNPEYQYRIRSDKPTPAHYEMLKDFADNPDLQFQGNFGSGWIDIPAVQIKWGSSAQYRIKPEKDFRIGDIVRSTITGVVVIVTGPVKDNDGGFTGTILKDDGYNRIGETRYDWDEDCFEVIDNPFLEVE